MKQYLKKYYRYRINQESEGRFESMLSYIKNEAITLPIKRRDNYYQEDNEELIFATTCAWQ